MSADGNLNALLRWSIENDPEATRRAAALLNSNPSAAQTGSGGGGGIALHASDPYAQLQQQPGSSIPQSKEEADAVLAALAGRQAGMKRTTEAEMMVEQMAVAMGKIPTVDGGKAVDHEDRVVALDNFEMLIESLDNANLLLPLKLWEPLFSLLHSPSGSASTSEGKESGFAQEMTSEQSEEIQAAAAWIIGTAVQNNPKCQTELLTWGTSGTGNHGRVGGERPVTTLLRLLLTSGSTQVRNKSAYAISALLKHYPAAVRHFSCSSTGPSESSTGVNLDQTSCLAGWGAGSSSSSSNDADSSDALSASTQTIDGARAWFAQHGHGSLSQVDHSLNGWSVLAHALLDPSMLVRRKVAFLINSLLLQWSEAETEEANRQAAAAADSRPAPSGAPAELPPETMREGSLSYDGLLGAMVEQGVIRTLLLSLLPEDTETTHQEGDDGAADVSVYAGPNGDEEPRKDEDYAEKTVRAVVCFARCASAASSTAGRAIDEAERKCIESALSPSSSSAGGGRLSNLYERLVKELEGAALGTDEEDGQGAQDQDLKRWQELGLDRSELEWFAGWVAQLSARR
ncbi:unnamed protein product [Tilletia laevis]|uniref:Nucleotide exchange factor Fes1 domain-containing protein n=2 Tax=Tilletia TaxID=13289 RepID=A0A177UJA9_9BASI|nr:hypothetical protein CF336_g2347 [Tilletia laevis]KAE8202488.1 hypothetical protein CF328_g2182 [Tilletia controversa]KAE8263665.1 hypothetical protein A4X03_0g1517 [Tilletia caries]KAE8206911.1 hypothetical protein CF335_g1526 [Tilletia laevis]CAD6892072.1 unnamed protein product [Tilletia caries]